MAAQDDRGAEVSQGPFATPFPAPSTLGQVGEDALVGGIIAQFRPLPRWVDVGPGDDAAVLSIPGAVVASTDTLVEERDFRRRWSSGHDVGVKVAAQNFADIAAMGAVPMALLVSISAPADVGVSWTAAVVEGLEDEAARARAHVVGGDVSSASEIVLTGTALGRLPEGVRAVRRAGASPGDVVALAGSTGRSAAGWALLRAGLEPDGDAVVASLVAAHRAPRPPYRAGPDAAGAGASSMIDTSDGLVRDAVRIADASGVSLALDSSALAPGSDLLAAAAALVARTARTATGTTDDGVAAFELARDWVFTGGEDHALVATFPRGAVLPPSWRAVGVVRARESSPVLVDGQPWRGRTGWTHFGDD